MMRYLTAIHHDYRRGEPFVYVYSRHPLPSDRMSVEEYGRTIRGIESHAFDTINDHLREWGFRPLHSVTQMQWLLDEYPPEEDRATTKWRSERTVLRQVFGLDVCDR